MFNEKKTERDPDTKTNLPVVMLPKYNTGREAAIKLINEKEYLNEADFWILMNRSRDKSTMYYSGLIISHNGCLKINDNSPKEKQFRPECITIDKQGYGNSLVYTYCCPEQGIYEVGEASAKNCKNEYPYAMAFKRCFDRVVLKLCGLAFYGVYSDSEADEFKEDPGRSVSDEKQENKPAEQMNNEAFSQLVNGEKAEEIYTCIDCGMEIMGTSTLTAKEIAEGTKSSYGRILCRECGLKEKRARIESTKKNAG